MFYFQDDFEKGQKVLKMVTFGDTISIISVDKFSIPVDNEGQVFFVRNGDSNKWNNTNHKDDHMQGVCKEEFLNK